MDFFRVNLFLFVCITRVSFSFQSKEQVLLDMRELGWLTSPYEDGWEIVQTVVNGSLFYTYSVCNIDSADQDNWLRTTFIQRRPGMSRVSVELRFAVRDCNTIDGAWLTCKETFNLFISEADADVGTNFRKGQFRKVATIAPDELTRGRGALRINVETRAVGPLSRKGFYLAFQDMGACVALLGVRVYYKTCPSTVQSLAAFPETVADALKEVEGACVENAVSQATPRIYCTTDGEWVVPVGQCQCRAGHESTGDSCQACKPGYFKSSTSSGSCQVCPDNTEASAASAVSCPCKEGFYRSPSDSSTSACSAPPSAPRDLSSATLAEGRLQLSWSRPLVTGGRSDLTYSVLCERCDEDSSCVPCGDKVRFEPQASGLRDSVVVASELDSHLNYTFTVEAHSGVSRYSTQRPTASITTALHYTDAPKVTLIRLDERSPTSLSLSWALSRRSPAHVSHRYELMYRRKDDNTERDVTTYTVLVLEKSSVQIPDLHPDTTYMFRVQALSAEGIAGSYSLEHEFQTLPMESLMGNNSIVVMGAVVGGAVMLVVVVAFLLLRKRMPCCNLCGKDYKATTG